MPSAALAPAGAAEAGRVSRLAGERQGCKASFHSCSWARSNIMISSGKVSHESLTLSQ